jgi:hypothetical protein
MEIYIHSAGNEDPELIEIEGTALVRALLEVGGGQGAELVMIEEAAGPIDLDITIEQAGIHHRDHVHRGRCRRVDVRIRYNGDKSHEFHPVATIRTIFEWATGSHGFNLTPEQKAEHVLALPGADHFLDWEVRIGSVVTPGSCDVVLDLAPKSRFEG